MRNTLLLLAVFFALTITSVAAPLCTSVTLDQLIGGGALAGTGCQVTDKIFNGFSYTGDIAAANVVVSFQPNGPVPAGATIQFTPNNGANWAALTNLSFTTTIDTTICPTCKFVATLDQIFTPPTPNANAGTFTHSGFGSVTLNGLSPANLSGQTAVGGTSVATRFVQTGGSTLQSVSSTFNQTAVPEPATFALLGGGLVAFAMYRRKRA